MHISIQKAGVAPTRTTKTAAFLVQAENKKGNLVFSRWSTIFQWFVRTRKNQQTRSTIDSLQLFVQSKVSETKDYSTQDVDICGERNDGNDPNSQSNRTFMVLKTYPPAEAQCDSSLEKYIIYKPHALHKHIIIRSWASHPKCYTSNGPHFCLLCFAHTETVFCWLFYRMHRLVIAKLE